VLVRQRPEVQEVPRALTGALIRLGLATVVGTVAVTGYAAWRIWQQGQVDESDHPVDAIVVLGAAQYDGVPSPVFQARLDHAINLFKRGGTHFFVVTGGRAPGDRFSEAASAQAYAEAHGVTRSRAAGHFLEIARDAIREREGVPGSRADELLEAVDGLRATVDILGPPTFGMLRLLAHWASQGGGVKVSEDELLAELRSAGADEWEQAVAESERDLQETPGGKVQGERR